MTNEQQMRQEDREAFFALYWGQRVWRSPKTDKCYSVNVETLMITNRDFLELRPLSSITDEHANQGAKIIGCYSPGDDGSWYRRRILAPSFFESVATLQETDYLRSKGYLVPFRHYSIQDLLELGVAKYANQKQH